MPQRASSAAARHHPPLPPHCHGRQPFEFQFIFQLVQQRTGALLVDYRPPDPYVALYLPEQCAL